MSAAYRTSSQQMQNYLDGFNLTYLNNVRFNISQGAAMDSTNSRLMTGSSVRCAHKFSLTWKNDQIVIQRGYRRIGHAARTPAS